MGQAWSKESPPPGKEGEEEEEQSWIRGPGRRVSEEESARLARLDDVVWSPLGTRATLDRWRVPGLKVEPPAKEVVLAGSGPDQQLLNKTMYVEFPFAYSCTLSQIMRLTCTEDFPPNALSS